MLDLRKLRYFLTVAEELHFGRAALRLHLAQPPLTRQISALEAELGFKLFDRTSRTVSLTAQGRSFLPYARGVLEQVELAQVIAGKLAAGTAGQRRWAMSVRSPCRTFSARQSRPSPNAFPMCS